MPLGYFFRHAEAGVIEIHEEEFFYRMDEAALNEAIAHLKANKRAYTSEEQYNQSMLMYTSALRFLKEEQS